MVEQGVDAHLAALPDARRPDALALVALMTECTATAPRLWPGSIVGFGTLHYRYASGREGDTMRVGFAARSAGLVLHVTGYLDDYADLLERLGPYRAGKGCLTVKRLRDVDARILREVVVRSFAAGAEPPRDTPGGPDTRP